MPICDPMMLEATRKSVEEYIDRTFDNDCKKLQNILRQSKLNYEAGTTNNVKIQNHIDYEPKSRKEWSDFKALIYAELKLRLSDKSQSKQFKAITTRTFEDQRRALKEFVDCEQFIMLAKRTIDRHEPAKTLAVALAVEKLIPCILHMKMRIGEKIFHFIVNSALERYEESKFDGDKRKELVNDLENCMNTQVFGNPATGRVSQWSFSWDDGGRRMLKYGMSGVTAGKVMRSLHFISAVLYHPKLDQESHSEMESELIRDQNLKTHTKWVSFYKNLNPMWDCIERKEDFGNSDIATLHKYTCNFMEQWLDLTKGKHMTNYIHIVGAGHLTYFASQYGNLYRFSQQGWESLNKLIKHYYYNNTNHGGSYGNGGKDTHGNYTNGTLSGQHCYPLMRFCQRFMMWKLGFGDKYFEDVAKQEQIVEVLHTFELEEESTTNLPELQFGII
jgi:hypothetical protein